ncbi:hypothetical protein R4B61_00430 [Fructilactobacillus vespulae]|uniref:hypothetical protein n=1 Tax=Fructilactobacillus vespulae TaxID=1249630 RepID=UPI0039B3A8D1
MTNTFDNIRKWADKHDLNKITDKQVIKVMEEAGEISKISLKKMCQKLGRCFKKLIYLILMVDQHDWNIENLINEAYDVIKDRTSKNNNGTFIKEADIHG